jgi:hypothetical protein
MPPIHLNDYERDSLSYKENARRFCLQRELGTHVRAYNIDVNGPGEQYFKALYTHQGHQGRRSADGIYVGSFHESGRQVYFVLVIELEGHATFEDAVGQVKDTLEHFCQHFQDPALDDDGARHHEQAVQQPRPYTAQTNHIVAGIVVGSQGRLGMLERYREWPIVCINSRQPVQDKPPVALFQEIASYTGQRFW